MDQSQESNKERERRVSGSFLPRLSVDRPISVIMDLVAMLTVGAIAYTRIPLGLIPEGLEGDRLHIRVDYPNTSPEELEQKVMRPIEEAVATVPRVERISVSASRGGAGRR